MQDTQEYIDNLPTLKVADVAKLSNKEKLAIKHFKVSRGCGMCGCMVVDCPCCNPEHLCDEHEIFYRGYCPLCYEEGQQPYYTDEDE